MNDYDIAMEEYYNEMEVSEVMPAESGIEASVVTKVGGETAVEAPAEAGIDALTEDTYTGEGMDAASEDGLYAEDGADYEGDMSYMDGDMGYMDGDMSYMDGDMGYMDGDMSYMDGDMSYMDGDMGYMDGDMGYMGDMGDMGYKDGDMGDMGYMDYMGGMETGMETASSPMASGLFVFGIAGISLLVGIGLGVLTALLKAKKGLKPYED